VLSWNDLLAQSLVGNSTLAPVVGLGSFCNSVSSRLGLFLLLSLFEPYPWASAVLIDEFDTR